MSDLSGNHPDQLGYNCICSCSFDLSSFFIKNTNLPYLALTHCWPGGGWECRSDQSCDTSQPDEMKITFWVGISLKRLKASCVFHTCEAISKNSPDIRGTHLCGHPWFSDINRCPSNKPQIFFIKKNSGTLFELFSGDLFPGLLSEQDSDCKPRGCCEILTPPVPGPRRPGPSHRDSEYVLPRSV